MRLVVFLILLVIYSFQLFKPEAQRERADYRDSVDVIRYSIHLTFRNLQDRILEGFTVIHCTFPKGNQGTFAFDLAGLKVDSVTSPVLRNVQFFQEGETVRGTFLGKLVSSDTVTLIIYYQGTPLRDKRWGGFFFVDDEAFNYGIGMDATPPNFGRVWFPCIDNFNDRAYYTFHVTVPTGYTAVCNGTLCGVKEPEKGYITWVWEMKQTIPTYLASVAVGRYIKLEGSYQGLHRSIPWQIYCLPEDSIKTARSFQNLSRWMQIFETRFTPYAWDRIGYVIVPFNHGAMEHATNITMARNTVGGSTQFETLYAHELSHHWFGNLVTCASEADMWLNEGWASYCEAIVTEDLYGEQAFHDYVRRNQLEVLVASHVADGGYFPVYGVPHSLTYGSTVYDKGSLVVHNLRGYLGDSLFFDAIKKYLKQYAFRNCSVHEFEQFLSRETRMDLKPFFQFWVYGKGFNDLEIDSVRSIWQYGRWKVSLQINQRLRGTYIPQETVKIEIGVLDSLWKMHVYPVKWTGNPGMLSLDLPFRPLSIILDPDEKIADASVEETKIIEGGGDHFFRASYFSVFNHMSPDSAWVRAEQHFLPPSGRVLKQRNIRLSSERYWRISLDCSPYQNLAGRFFFTRSISEMPEGTTSDALVLLYRKHRRDSWQVLPAQVNGNEQEGFLETTPLRKGYYCIGVKH